MLYHLKGLPCLCWNENLQLQASVGPLLNKCEINTMFWQGNCMFSIRIWILPQLPMFFPPFLNYCSTLISPRGWHDTLQLEKNVFSWWLCKCCSLNTNHTCLAKSLQLPIILLGDGSDLVWIETATETHELILSHHYFLVPRLVSK